LIQEITVCAQPCGQVTTQACSHPSK